MISALKLAQLRRGLFVTIFGMDSVPCPGCMERDRRIAELEKSFAELQAKVDRLTALLEQAQRSGKRQSAPFSKGEPKDQPKTPGRKRGDQHGQHGHRPAPPDETVDEVLEAPLPDACPHCGGALAEDEAVDEQFQTDIPLKPIRHHKSPDSDLPPPVI